MPAPARVVAHPTGWSDLPDEAWTVFLARVPAVAIVLSVRGFLPHSLGPTIVDSIERAYAELGRALAACRNPFWRGIVAIAGLPMPGTLLIRDAIVGMGPAGRVMR